MTLVAGSAKVKGRSNLQTAKAGDKNFGFSAGAFSLQRLSDFVVLTLSLIVFSGRRVTLHDSVASQVLAVFIFARYDRDNHGRFSSE
jgi:hypothetical protein